ncbi:MAG: thioredoxin [Amycolatopsis sp.]|uniref:thioredoxin n=1 Tax=Amycolatopsis sp. TaxID=37632 RepID=UPI0026352948|nr:thioredoxin [Amycolatopsis sp.]MCU1686255.1 thioredoxin [Amycolatopsis sp.]
MSVAVSGEVLPVTDATFAEEVLKHGQPVLVDFWATWCGPCRMVAPVLAEIAAERADSLTIRKINADENSETMRTYQVMSLPTLILFLDGKPVQAFVGARPKTRLLAELDAALAV